MSKRKVGKKHRAIEECTRVTHYNEQEKNNVGYTVFGMTDEDIKGLLGNPGRITLQTTTTNKYLTKKEFVSHMMQPFYRQGEV